MNKKILSVAVITPLLALGLVSAVPAPKVFVCKYVGQPGVNEHLQTGNNPISVSQNAIPNFQGVGSYFADAQGRSYVLALDTGQPEPDVSACPKPDAPKEPVTPPVTETPKVETPVTPAQTPRASEPAVTPVPEGFVGK